jgi:hypothetical protein
MKLVELRVMVLVPENCPDEELGIIEEVLADAAVDQTEWVYAAGAHATASRLSEYSEDDFELLPDDFVDSYMIKYAKEGFNDYRGSGRDSVVSTGHLREEDSPDSRLPKVWG